MSKSVFQFTQFYVFSGVPRVVRGPPGPRKGEAFLVFRDVHPQMVSFSIADKPGLFRWFMAIEDVEVLRFFCSTEGAPVIVSERLDYVVDPKTSKREPVEGVLVSVSMLLQHAAAMRWTWALWEAISKRDYAALRRSIVVFRRKSQTTRDAPVVTPASPVVLPFLRPYDGLPREYVLADPDDEVERIEREEALRRFTPEEGDTILQLATTTEVLAAANVLMDMVFAGAGRRNVLLDYRSQPGAGCSVILEASCLLAALWHQMSEATTGGAEYRKCLECPKPFEMSKAGRNHKAIFCSDQCRAAHQRRKNARALQLSAKGLGAKEVSTKMHAEGLKMKPDAVKNLLARTKGAKQ